MSEPLTLDRFERFEGTVTKRFDGIDKRFDSIDDQLADQDEILTAIKQTIDDVSEKVDGIEKLLWHGQRLEEIEHRIRQLAERTGNADLATPLPQPLISH